MGGSEATDIRFTTPVADGISCAVAYLGGREEWGKTMAAYYLWHKRRGVEDATARDE